MAVTSTDIKRPSRWYQLWTLFHANVGQSYRVGLVELRKSVNSARSANLVAGADVMDLPCGTRADIRR
jgi:hypothetical protein